jgi:hypothetical protein
LQKSDGAGDDGTLVFAAVAFLARDIHAAGMASFVEHDTRVAFEGRLRIKHGHQSILYKAGRDQLGGRKGLRVETKPF